MTTKVTKKLVHDVVCEVVGEDVLPVIEYLKEKHNISEFKIAEALNEEVNRVRNMLYRLHTHYLVTYIRKKDKLKGWYISYWTLNLGAVLSIQTKIQLQQIENLTERLKREEDNLNGFFLCPSLCTRLSLDSAIEYEFKCPECGSLMKQQDNARTISRLKEQILEIQALLPQN
jgi:transcription initiation factor TFIIE subunit alpha